MNVMPLEANAKSYITDNKMPDAQNFNGRNTDDIFYHAYFKISEKQIAFVETCFL